MKFVNEQYVVISFIYFIKTKYSYGIVVSCGVVACMFVTGGKDHNCVSREGKNAVRPRG